MKKTVLTCLVYYRTGASIAVRACLSWLADPIAVWPISRISLVAESIAVGTQSIVHSIAGLVTPRISLFIELCAPVWALVVAVGLVGCWVEEGLSFCADPCALRMAGSPAHSCGAAASRQRAVKVGGSCHAASPCFVAGS